MVWMYFFHDQCAYIETLIHLMWLLAICIGRITFDANCVLFLLQLSVAAHCYLRALFYQSLLLKQRINIHENTGLPQLDPIYQKKIIFLKLEITSCEIRYSKMPCTNFSTLITINTQWGITTSASSNIFFLFCQHPKAYQIQNININICVIFK
jgi:hypothetical protein